jgi:ATP adenylyltransferase
VERLWTPWRMKYVTGVGQSSGECLFCELPAQQRDEENLVLCRGQHVFCLLNLYPYNTGHLMVAPYAHSGDLLELPAEVGAELLAVTQRSIAALSSEYQPDGYNVGMNLGRVAGAGLPDHLHLHVVPRWSGDTNFMPLTADTRVLPETLRETYSRLRGAMSL